MTHMVINGGWFSVWQSKTWNGQEAALRLGMAIPGVPVLANQPDKDLT
jgi:predicted small integral membrane protein